MPNESTLPLIEKGRSETKIDRPGLVRGERILCRQKQMKSPSTLFFW